MVSLVVKEHQAARGLRFQLVEETPGGFLRRGELGQTRVMLRSMLPLVSIARMARVCARAGGPEAMHLASVFQDDEIVVRELLDRLALGHHRSETGVHSRERSNVRCLGAGGFAARCRLGGLGSRGIVLPGAGTPAPNRNRAWCIAAPKPRLFLLRLLQQLLPACDAGPGPTPSGLPFFGWPACPCRRVLRPASTAPPYPQRACAVNLGSSFRSAMPHRLLAMK